LDSEDERAVQRHHLRPSSGDGHGHDRGGRGHLIDGDDGPVQRFTDVESLFFRDAAEIDAPRIEGKPQAQPPRRRVELREAASPGGARVDLDGLARAAVLSDVLLAVYCVLRERPDEKFGGETPGRKRYARMGVLPIA
jgi:hypothetical protein